MMADDPALAGLAAAGTAAGLAEFALGIDHSFSGRIWRMRAFDPDAERGIQLAGFTAPLAQLLASRGVTHERVLQYLNPKLRDLLPDPSRLAHMQAAAARFVLAVKRRETIAVLADYDVDGACSASLILQYLKQLGQ